MGPIPFSYHFLVVVFILVLRLVVLVLLVMMLLVVVDQHQEAPDLVLNGTIFGSSGNFLRLLMPFLGRCGLTTSRLPNQMSSGFRRLRHDSRHQNSVP